MVAFEPREETVLREDTTEASNLGVPDVCVERIGDHPRIFQIPVLSSSPLRCRTCRLVRRHELRWFVIEMGRLSRIRKIGNRAV
jgi:hypothetical protein